MNDRDGGVPLEIFIQALQTQLDRAQTAMAIKARNQNLPLTFAVKDISLDLRAHIEVVKNEVRVRPAGPGEADASTLHFSLTTITRPMIEENTVQPLAHDEPSLKEALGDSLSDEEQRNLEFIGVQTVSQLRNLEKQEQIVERVTRLPVDRLRQALARAAQPMISRVATELPVNPNGGKSNEGNDKPLLLRIRGHNLMRERAPQVRIGGETVPVVKATEKELLVAPLAHQMGGKIVIETDPGMQTETEFDFYPMAEMTAEMMMEHETVNGQSNKGGRR